MWLSKYTIQYPKRQLSSECQFLLINSILCYSRPLFQLNKYTGGRHGKMTLKGWKGSSWLNWWHSRCLAGRPEKIVKNLRILHKQATWGGAWSLQKPAQFQTFIVHCGLHTAFGCPHIPNAVSKRVRDIDVCRHFPLLFCDDGDLIIFWSSI